MRTPARPKSVALPCRACPFDAGEAPPSAPPRLEFAWQPDRLVFLAQGAGPYLVAYGSATVKPALFSLEALLGKSSQADLKPQMVRPGAPFELGGKALAGARPPLPWKKIGLWGVLLFGVALIGAMSFSLHSALRKEGEE